MIEAMSARISQYIYKHNDRNDVSLEVMQFALNSLLTNTITVLLSILVALLTGTFYDTMIALIGCAAFRNLAGGYHFRSSTVCVLASTSVLLAIPYVPVHPIAFYALTGASLLLILRFAPSDLRNHTRISNRGLMMMKVVSALLVAANLLIESDILSVAFFVSAVSLIPFKGGETHE